LRVGLLVVFKAQTGAQLLLLFFQLRDLRSKLSRFFLDYLELLRGVFRGLLELRILTLVLLEALEQCNFLFFLGLRTLLVDVDLIIDLFTVLVHRCQQFLLGLLRLRLLLINLLFH